MLGVVDVVYAPRPLEARAERAAADGFAHVDVTLPPPGAPALESSTLALPVGCPTAFPEPRPGFCSTPAPPAGPGRFDRTVAWFRAAPGALLEPWKGAAVGSFDECRAVMEAVPGLRLLVDTGHVADWGGDPLALLPYAGHVQLRQGGPGHAQLPSDDARGVVDFAAVVETLRAIGYDGLLSVEYFDLPEHGWPLDDPRAAALDLAARVRPLLR